MLEFMRKRRNSTLLLVVFAVIILVFLFFGLGPPGNVDSEKSLFATVNGVKIPASAYNAAYKRELDNYKYMYGDKLDSKMLEKLNLRKTVGDMLINRTLILTMAKKEGVEAGRDDVRNEIMKNQIFQKDGAYDLNLYLNILSSSGVKPEDYEESVKEELIIRKLRERVIADIKVTDDDVKTLYGKQNREISFKYAEAAPSGFKSQMTVTDAEAAEYLKVNGDAFMVPDKVKAVYASIDKAVAARSVKVTDKDMKDYYTENIEKYRLPAEFKARHILLRVNRDASGKVDEKDKASKKTKMDGIVERLKKGEDFAVLAKEFSDDPGSAAEGGDLGYLRLEQMVAPFANAVSMLKIGETSPVVETDFGLHVIKLEAIKQESVKTFDSVKAEIGSVLKTIKSTDAAGRLVEEIAGVLRAESSVAKIKTEASKRGAVVVETGFITENDANAELLKHKGIADAVFMTDKGAVTGIIDEGSRLYVAKVLDRIDRHVPPIKDIMASVKDMAKAEKAVKAASAKASELLELLKGGMSIDEAAKKLGLKSGKTAYTSYSKGAIPELKLSGVRNDDLFALSKENPYYREPIESAGSFYVLAFGDAKAADMSGFEAKKTSVADWLLTVKKKEAMDKWLEDAKAKAKIKVNENYL
ncbi:MAG: SurA N-terminal domain-containing protein [Deltaproteobacteria bacterium]|nr:SurA N-terminal domain-containing protein [Deltaproteobacteria bacterium]